MTTITVNPKSVAHKWYIIDAKDVILGRLATKVSHVLMGKHKPSFSTEHDNGDHIVIINAEKVALTGKKREQMSYFSHSTYSGGGRSLSFSENMAIDAGNPIRHAVKRMLPKTSLGRNMAKKLYVYGGDNHPHTAQKPETLVV